MYSMATFRPGSVSAGQAVGATLAAGAAAFSLLGLRSFTPLGNSKIVMNS
jgi:hypothetical protein